VANATEGEGDHIWNRLRQRKLVQWGIAYVAGAWGMLQGLGYVSGLYDWPRQFQQIALLLLVLGFPIALTLAWYHGDRGEQRIGRTELAILTLLFLLGGGLFWRYQHMSETASVATPPASMTPAAANADDRSIAVLPFVNMSDDPKQEYFSEGMAEELLNLLTTVPELRVISRASAFFFKGKDVPVPEIGRQLHVAHVLEGSVRKSGDRVRISVQLVDASSDTQLWSESWDRRIGDIFAVQDEIAAAVVGRLKLSLLNGAPRARAVNPEAYALYLQARQPGRQSTAEGYEQAIALLQQALALQPDYVAALDALASVYLNQGNYHLRPMEEATRLARDASNRTLALDPDFAAAYARLGTMALQYDGDLASAAAYLERAMGLAPTDPIVVNSAALIANSLGRPKLAIPLIDYVLASDPINPAMQANAGLVYLFARRPDESLVHFRVAAQLSPGGIGHEFAVGLGLLQKGDSAGALAEVRKEANERMRLTGLAIVDHAVGRDAESNEAMSQVVQKYGADAAYQIAIAGAWRNEPDRVFEWLEKAASAHDPRLSRLGADPNFDKLHGDPRWLPFVRKHGMAPEQLAAIKFNVKVPK